VTAAVSPDLAAPLSAIIDGLCRAVAARGAAERRFAPLALLLWGWLRRVARRFAATAARAHAATPRPSPVRARTKSGRSSPRLPRGFAWLLRALPETSPFATQLQSFLAEPEVAALLAAAPHLARPLRPLCRMLGLRAVLPPPRRASQAPATTGQPAGAPRPHPVRPPPDAPKPAAASIPAAASPGPA
jgi:hypothetical protein